MSITPRYLLIVVLLALAVVLSGCGSGKKGGGYGLGVSHPSAASLRTPPAA